MKTNLHKQFQTDSSKEEQGVWVDFEDGVAVRVRRLSSKASQKAREKAEAPYKARLRSGKLDDDTAELIAIHQLARGVISDWKGLKDADGKDIPYNPDTAFEILSDDSLKDFRGEILQISLERDAYKADEDEEAEKNSESSSDTA